MEYNLHKMILKLAFQKNGKTDLKFLILPKAAHKLVFSSTTLSLAISSENSLNISLVAYISCGDTSFGNISSNKYFFSVDTSPVYITSVYTSLMRYTPTKTW